MKFILSIDTEGDNQWVHGRELSVRNIEYVPRFQALCDRHLVKPTYLVTSEVCEDPRAREIFSEFLKKEKAEIGAHLHSWTTPPFMDKDGFRFNDENHAFLTEFQENIISEKVKCLKGQIETAFGISPGSFRSGRYGFNEKVASILVENSILVDSSVTPFTSWTNLKGMPGGAGGPDFIENTPFPYSCKFDNGSLIEIPVTILPTKYPLNRNYTLTRKYQRKVNDSIILKVIRKLCLRDQPLWLRPLPSMNKRLFEELISEALRIRLPFIVMMFHSSELMPGCSIYRKDEASVEKLYELLEDFFGLLRNFNIASVTMTEAAKAFRS